MKIFKILSAAAISAALLQPVSALAQSSTEMYYIFDIKTEASRQDVGNAIKKGLKRFASNIQTSNPLVMGEPPVTPKRFEIVDMSSQFQGHQLGGLFALANAQGGGFSLKTAKCEGAVWTAKFSRDISSQNLKMDLCLFPYQGGYSLNVYGQDTHKNYSQGRGISGMIAQGAVKGLLGGPGKWTQRAYTNMRKVVYEETGAIAVLKEGQPEIDFTFKDEPAAVAEAPAVASPVAAPAAVATPTAPAPAQQVAPAPVVAPAPAPVPSVDCTGLSDEQCFAKLRSDWN